MSADSAQYNAIRVGCSGKYRTADIRIKIQKIHKLNTTQIKQGKQRETQQNKTTMVHLSLTTLGQETRQSPEPTLGNEILLILPTREVLQTNGRATSGVICLVIVQLSPCLILLQIASFFRVYNKLV